MIFGLRKPDLVRILHNARDANSTWYDQLHQRELAILEVNPSQVVGLPGMLHEWQQALLDVYQRRIGAAQSRIAVFENQLNSEQSAAIVLAHNTALSGFSAGVIRISEEVNALEASINSALDLKRAKAFATLGVSTILLLAAGFGLASRSRKRKNRLPQEPKKLS